MAEETKAMANEQQEASEVEESATEQETKPDVEKLMAELAAEKAARMKDKAALDKALKEKGELTKNLRAKMTASEQEAEAKAEAEKQREEEFNKVKAELNLIKAKNAYRAITDESVVETLIAAISDADHASIANIIEKEKEKAVKLAQAEWIKTRPAVNNGTGNSLTKEQILEIKDQSERQKAIAANIDLFK